MPTYSYVIVGAGLAGASAVEGVREVDPGGSILLVGSESHLPYDRPPLTKQLWSGKKQEADIVLHPAEYYSSRGIETVLGVSITAIDRRGKTVRDEQGREYGYDKLLLATGGTPRRLPIPGGDLEGVFYFRTLDDYRTLRREATPGRSAVVVGGGFIGSELAASLSQAQVDVTMIFPDPYLVARVFPEALGRRLSERYRQSGVRLVEDRPMSFARREAGFLIHTAGGRQIESDLLVVGVGIAPAVELARSAGLAVDDGVLVDELLRTSDPDVYAAGDVANFPYLALGQRRRVEHWDNALTQGRQAGRNMAGNPARYDHMPYFFSDLFEFGYEAVGEVDSRLATKADWQKEYETGVIRYLREGRVRGVMMCNVWDQIATARAWIAADNPPSGEDAHAGAAAASGTGEPPAGGRHA